MVSSYRFVPGKPHSSGVLVSRTAQGKQGQALSRLLLPRVQLSPARPDTVLRSPPQLGHWWPPVDPGPFPRVPQGTFSFDLARNCWGGTPLHTTSHVVPTLLVATFKWPWGPPPRDTRAQSSASDQSSSLDPGSSSRPNICTSQPLPRGPRLDTEFLTVKASVRESSKQRAKTIALRIQLFFFIPRRRQTATLGKTVSAQGFVTQTAASRCFPVEFYVKEQHNFLARARHKSAE